MLIKLIKKIINKIRIWRTECFYKKHIGYADHNQFLKRCPCCHKKSALGLFKDVNNMYDEQGVIENDIYCNYCKDVVAHWAYGSIGLPYNAKTKKKIELNEECPF